MTATEIEHAFAVNFLKYSGRFGRQHNRFCLRYKAVKQRVKSNSQSACCRLGQYCPPFCKGSVADAVG